MEDPYEPVGVPAPSPLSPPLVPPGPGAREVNAYALEFTGSGGEYFRVWIVNVLLTVVTLGVYTPWARRRTAQYFYGHTLVAGSPLEFVGRLRSMLFGFLIVALLFIAYNVALSTGQELVVNLLRLAAVLAAPLILGSAMRFRLAATRWRGLRLRFVATWAQVYRASWPLFVLALLWFALLSASAWLAPELGQIGQPPKQQSDSLIGSTIGAGLAAAAGAQRGSDRGAQAAHGAEDEEQADEQKLDRAIAARKERANARAKERQRQSDLADRLRARLPGLGALWLLGLLLISLCASRIDYNARRLFFRCAHIGAEAGRCKLGYSGFLKAWMGQLGLFFLCLLGVSLAAGLIVVLIVALMVALAGGSVAAFGQSFLQLLRTPQGLAIFMALYLLLVLMVLVAPVIAMSWREARIFQLVWNGTGVSQLARFQCQLSVKRYVRLRVKNLLLSVLTIGFYRPFARVSEYRMKLESVLLFVKGDLEQLAGVLERQQQGGLGDALADLAGLDLIG